MENSLGFVAVFAVSGTAVFIARQAHKRLLSDFKKKLEFEFRGPEKCRGMKKKVRFADDVMEPSSNNEEYRRKHLMIMAMKYGQRVRTRKNKKTGL